MEVNIITYLVMIKCERLCQKSNNIFKFKLTLKYFIPQYKTYQKQR